MPSHKLQHKLEGDDLVDGQPFEIYYIDPNAKGDDLLEVISRMESKADDRQLQAEIDQLALGLETLLLQREAGKWKYIGFSGDNIRSSNSGEFALALMSDDLSASENVITLNQTDLDDKLHGFGDVEIGDYVEIVDLDKPDEYALFVIDSEPDGDGIVSINLKLKDKGNNLIVGTTCEIRFFAINEQNLDLTELDDRYVKLDGSKTMTGALTAPRANIKNTDFGDGVLLVEGKRDNTSNVSARVTFSNSQNTNAYGSLEWYATNGNNGQFKFTDKLILKKPSQTNADGFTIKGYIDGSQPNGDLLKVYHNNQRSRRDHLQGQTGRHRRPPCHNEVGGGQDCGYRPSRCFCVKACTELFIQRQKRHL